MLKELRINNFAIIDNLSVEFTSGLTALTGETGAGKSIIIDALNLILGGRADSNFIRTGESSATVESVFEIKNLQTLDILSELGIDANNGEVVLRRTISNTGKNRCMVNDCAVTVGVLFMASMIIRHYSIRKFMLIFSICMGKPWMKETNLLKNILNI